MNTAKPSPSQHWRISQDDLPIGFHEQNHCLRQLLPAEAGLGYSNIHQMEPDLSCIETHYTPAKNLAVTSQIDFQEPRLVVTLGLTGHSCFKAKKGHEILFNEGYTTITAFNSSVGERQYQADKTVKQLRFSLSKGWFQQHFGNTKTQQLFNKAGTQQLSHQPSSTSAAIAAQHFLSCNLGNEVKSLFLQGQALAILASELDPIVSLTGGTIQPKPVDLALAHKARDILAREYQHPPTVEALSKRLGTNQFKLKQLFHQVFNNTPYGLLLEIRMAKAYRLLETGQYHVAVVADLVGYQHASNFSTAFFRHYGFMPKSIAKKR